MTGGSSSPTTVQDWDTFIKATQVTQEAQETLITQVMQVTKVTLETQITWVTLVTQEIRAKW